MGWRYSFDGLSCLFASTTYVVSTDDIGAIKKLTKLKIPMELLGGKVEERVVTRDEVRRRASMCGRVRRECIASAAARALNDTARASPVLRCSSAH